jgi:pimeloyl-ACP methyl ester carboxylesterase
MEERTVMINGTVTAATMTAAVRGAFWRNGARIAFTAFSTGGRGVPSAVALHCSASAGSQWRGLGAALGESCRLLAPDLHGSGGSEAWPGRRALRLADEAAIAADLAEREGEPVHLIGHSYGGGVALRAALDMPERIASLTLIEPSAFHLLRRGSTDDGRLYAEIDRVAEDVLRAVACGDYHAGMARFVDYWKGAPGTFAALSAAKRDSFAPRLPRTAIDFSALLAETAELHDYAAALRRTPVLIIEGGDSPAPSRRICRMLAGVLPAARLCTVRGVGHMAPLDAPQRIDPLVADFIAEAGGWTHRRRAAA